MLRRAGMICAVLLSLPAMANAWTITAKVASGTGTIQDGVTTLPSPGYVNVATGTATKDLNVAAGTGYVIKSVVVDGRAVAPTSGTTYTVSYNNVGSHTINAYFVAGSSQFTVTSNQAAGGTFTVQQLTPVLSGPTTGNLTLSGANTIKVVATPAGGYTASKITIGSTDYSVALGNATYNANTGAITVPSVSVSAATTVTATYAQTPVVSITGGTQFPALILDTASATNVPAVTVASTANAAAGAVTYTAALKDAAGNDALLSDGTVAAITVAGSTASFGYKKVGYAESHLATGTYTLLVTATGANGGTDVKGFQIIVNSAKEQVSNSCTGCHSSNSATIVTNWNAGGHAASAGHDQTTCFRCHNGKGPLYAETNAFTGNATTLYTPQLATPVGTMPTPIGCVTCHTDGPHAGAFRASAGWNPDGTGLTTEYNLCTSCHVLADTTGKQDHYHTAYSIKNDRFISDTHYDDPATAAGQGNENGSTIINKVEGYVVRMNKGTACADCHDVHMAEAKGATAAGEQTIQQQWARSGHAGKILAQKEAYLATNGVLDATSGYYKTATAAGVAGLSATYTSDATAQAWTHYNWDKTDNTAVAPAPSNGRGSCQKCHTATGASNYLNNPAGYDFNNNDFSHLAGWTKANGSTQNEVLYCWGCHKSATTGELRNPGAIKADYKFRNYTAVYPDVQASNVCLACHIGQASGTTITDNTAAGKNYANLSFVNSHYMAAGSLMYVKGGYTNFVPAQTAIAGATGTAAISYGQSLTSDADMTVDKTGAAAAGKIGSTHRKLGTAALASDNHFPPSNPAPAALLVNGPCATCHYPNGEHTLEFGDANYNSVCVSCHVAEGVTPLTAANYKSAFIEPQAEVFENALALALQVLKTNYNISYNQAAYPYFYDDNLAPGTAVKDWTRGGTVDGEKLMGACFNINLLKREPAAYAHARTYARRLVYDSIDFLDNKVIDQSVGATALASNMVDASSNPIYTKGAKAFDTALGTDGKYTVTVPASGTSESMTYLLGWVRSDADPVKAGAWNAWERP